MQPRKTSYFISLLGCCP